jgi:hypothetical protein
MKRFKRTTFCVALVAIAIVAVIASGAVAGDTPSVPAPFAKAEGVGRISAENFAVLSAARTPSDDLNLKSEAGGEPRLPIGIDPSETHRAPVSTAKGDLWIAPAADDNVCALFRRGDASTDVVAPAASCGPANGGPTVNYTEGAKGRVNIYGAVPDGFSSVKITLDDGSIVEAEVANNLFGVDGSSNPAKAVFSGKGGSTTVDLKA